MGCHHVHAPQPSNLPCSNRIPVLHHFVPPPWCHTPENEAMNTIATASEGRRRPRSGRPPLAPLPLPSSCSMSPHAMRRLLARLRDAATPPRTLAATRAHRRPPPMDAAALAASTAFVQCEEVVLDMGSPTTTAGSLLYGKETRAAANAALRGQAASLGAAASFAGLAVAATLTFAAVCKHALAPMLLAGS